MILLTSRTEVSGRLGRPLTPAEDARFDATNQDVSSYLFIVAPLIPEIFPVPQAVEGVATALVIESLSTLPGTAGVQQEALGGYSVSYRSTADGVTVKDAYLRILSPWRRPRIGWVQIDPDTAVAT